MAKITFGPIVSEARNKQGNVVFSRTRGGAVSRAWVLTGVRHSALQTTQRAQFKAATLRWFQTLTQDQRTAWNSFADAADPLPKPIGKNHRSGQNWFLACNATTNYWLGTFVDTPPKNLQSPNLTTLTLAANADSEDLTLTIAPVDASADIYTNLWATMPISPGITNWGKYLRRLALYDNTATFPKNLWAIYEDRFETPLAGQRIGLMARTMSASKGILGPKIITSAIVAGTADAMLQTQVTLTDAQIKALPTTPVTLIAAPGAGKLLVFHGALIKKSTAAGAYTNLSLPATQPLVAIYISNMSNPTAPLGNSSASTPNLTLLTALMAADTNGFWITPSANIYYSAGNAFIESSQNYATTDINTTLIIKATNGAGNFTGGNAANTWVVTVFYSIINAA